MSLLHTTGAFRSTNFAKKKSKQETRSKIFKKIYIYSNKFMLKGKLPICNTKIIRLIKTNDDAIEKNTDESI